MSRTIIYGTPGSTYTWSAQIALVEKKIPHELVEVAFGAHLQPPHRERHPFAKVPVLDHDGFVLYETQAILRYIDQLVPSPPLQPSDPRDAARMNQAIGILDAYFWRAAGPGVVGQRLFAVMRGLAPDEAVVQAAVPVVRTALSELDRFLGDRQFLAGDRLTMADIMVLPIVRYLLLTPEASLFDPHPRLRAWCERMSSRDSVRETEPQLARKG
ncbi:glutathione S-transferase family protein [Sorangium sp. So ce388]|uniref:glutathione S-transferase family protein n=1 Tax=Sorangium sp. So ce388 TaxID=3133309 RepID=UPI003F5C7856